MAIRFSKLNGLPVHDDGSEFRALGAHKPTGNFSLPNFESRYAVTPEDEWQETSLKGWNIPIFNQGQFGSCVGMGSTAAFTYAWLASGQAVHAFSPTYVYAHINGGRDQGAQVAHGLEALKSVGVCLMSEFPITQIYVSQIPNQAKITAKRFKAFEAYKINSWEELGTALNNGLAVVSGIAVGRNFSRLDKNGVAPLPDAIDGGHCMCHTGLKMIDGRWAVETQNSWGTSWGNNGFCYLREGHWNPRYGFPFDAFAIGGVKDDPEDDSDPPVLTKDKQNGDMLSVKG